MQQILAALVTSIEISRVEAATIWRGNLEARYARVRTASLRRRGRRGRQTRE
jgi:hypothetical protein